MKRDEVVNNIVSDAKKQCELLGAISDTIILAELNGKINIY